MENQNVNEELFYAVKENNIDKVSLLVSEGADIDSIFQNGDNALTVAVKADDIAMVTVLLNLNANPNNKNTDSDTPLIVALKNKGTNVDIIKLLLAHEAEIDIRNDSGVNARELLNIHENETIETQLVENEGLSKYEKVALLVAGGLVLGPVGSLVVAGVHAAINKNGVEGTLRFSDDLARNTVAVAKELSSKITENDKVKIVTDKASEKLAEFRASSLGTTIENKSVDAVNVASEAVTDAYKSLKNKFKMFK